jgi:hypothetical protein
MQIQSFQRCPMLILLFRQRYSIVDPHAVAQALRACFS